MIIFIAPADNTTKFVTVLKGPFLDEQWSRKPAIRKALLYLRHCLGEYPPGSRLPGLPALAAAAGVSHVTMLHAVHALRDEGLCSVVGGQGVTVGRVPAPSVPPRSERISKWLGLKDEIERDILHGLFSSGRRLPPLKELEEQYGVSYLTLKRALAALVQEGTLSVYAGTYRLPHLTVTSQQTRGSAGRVSPRAAIVLVVGGSQPGITAVDDPRFNDYLYWLERESYTGGFHLSLMTYDDSGGAGIFHTLHGSTRRFTDQQWVLGYLVFYSGINDMGQLLAQLSPSGKPIALVTTGGLLPAKLDAKLLRVFHTAYTETPGRDVGAYLVQQGHRHAAYISPYHRSPWSVNRLSGLRRAFESAGFAGGVVPFVREEYTHNDDYLRQVTARMDPERGTAFAAVARSMPKVLHGHVDELRRAYRELYRDREILNYCIPLFREALQDRRLTAWVCSIDYIALFAFSFLSGENIRIPLDLSLIGFDDLPAARSRALSTYRFDMPTLVHDMVAHVLNPSYRPLSRGGNCVEIGGMVVERATSGPAGTISRSRGQ